MVKHYNIGSMIAKKDKETQKPVLDSNGKQTYYIKKDKDAKILVNGAEVTGYLNISRPRDKYDRMLAKGTITEKEHAEKIAQFEKGGKLDYIQFEVSVAVEG